MFDGQGGGDHMTRAITSGFDLSGLLKVPRDRERLDNELEGVVFESSYGDSH